MRTQIQQELSYWFYLSPLTYVERKDRTLLYHTESGIRLTINSPSIKRLIDEVYTPKNLGVVRLPSDSKLDSESQKELKLILELNLGQILPVEDNKPKPINFLPILNLQKDIEKAKEQGDLSLVIDDLLGYLSKLLISLGGENNLCHSYLRKDNTAIDTSSKSTWASKNFVRRVFGQVKHSRLKQICLYSDNIFAHPDIKSILQLFEEYEVDGKLYCSLEHYCTYKTKALSLFQDINAKVDLYLICGTEYISYLSGLDSEELERYNVIFLIEDKSQYAQTSEYIERLKLKRYECTPIYTTKNIEFFEEFIYLTEDDIFDSPIEMRQIFCNQKLNSNNFGTLTVSSEGICRVNLHSERIGDLRQMSLLEVIYKELIQNTAWRETRIYPPCSTCLYQYLCPPPSSYEKAIGRGDLCHCKMT